MVNISFSWDDGSIYDLKIAKLFEKYSYRAMFFIPTSNWEHPSVSPEIIKEIINMKMEVGGHTSSHKYLTTLDRSSLENEIADNQSYLQDLTQTNVDMFCYPGGCYDSYIESVVVKYFKRARSARTMRFNIQRSFTVDTSFHFFDRGMRSVFKNVIQNDFSRLFDCVVSMNSDTFEFYRNLIFRLNSESRVYNVHIWGHGWELERFGLWGGLEEFLVFIKRNNIKVVSNEEMYL